MAKLTSENLAIDISLRWDSAEGVVYDLYFSWLGIPLINDEVIQRSNDWWSQARPSSFFFSEYAKLRPVAFFREMLSAKESQSLQPVDPDIKIIVDPVHAYPDDRSNVIWESDRTREKRLERTRLKKKFGKLPDDLFRVEFQVDTYNFKSSNGYSSDGIAFRFLVYREELESFARELESEREHIVSEYSDNPDGNGSADNDGD